MKKIDWTKWSAIAEILSAIAIVVTLLYLALQTQLVADQTEFLAAQTQILAEQTEQNFNAINANSRQVSIASDLQIIATILSNAGSDLLKFRDDLTDEEATLLEGILVMLVRSREHQWLQYRDGLLDEDTWRSYLSGLLSNLSTPSTRQWWVNSSGSFHPEFAAVVDEYLAEIEIQSEFTNRFLVN